MCGFEVYLTNSQVEQKQVLEIINESFHNKNRGPERSRVIILEKCIIVFHRLCIMNPSHTLDQPFIYESEDKKTTWYVLCNGEIYNYLDLDPNAKNDTSAIFTEYKKQNFNFRDLNNSLNGEYALCILEINPNETIIKFSTDTCSVRPLFYYFNNSYSTLVLSSLIGGIVNIPDINQQKIRRLNGGEACEFRVSDPIKNLKGVANFYSFNLPFVQVRQNVISDIQIALDNINKTLTKAVIDRLQTDRPFGCLLSGGLDSSLVAAIAARELKKRGQRLRTFTIGMKDSTDIPYARKVAEHIDSDHTEIEFNQEEALQSLEQVIKCCGTYDITTIRASVGQYLISKWISQNTDIKVIINGDGSDEAWMGYLYFHLAPNPEMAQIESAKLLYNIHHFDGLRVDRCISNWGLEARLPFLDKNMIELSYIINPELKVPRSENGSKPTEKWVLRKSFDNGLLPNDVLWRKKEAFSDSFSDTKKSWYTIIQDYINENYQIDSSKKWTVNPPVSKESQWYREIYEKYYGDSGHILPYYWLPNWCNTSEPSARVLSIYNTLEEDSSEK